MNIISFHRDYPRRVLYVTLCKLVSQKLWFVSNETGIHFTNGVSFVVYDANDINNAVLPNIARDMFLLDLFFVN
jgi:hypothetical protein